jgi:hypothetical protein
VVFRFLLMGRDVTQSRLLDSIESATAVLERSNLNP